MFIIRKNAEIAQILHKWVGLIKGNGSEGAEQRVLKRAEVQTFSSLESYLRRLHSENYGEASFTDVCIMA